MRAKPLGLLILVCSSLGSCAGPGKGQRGGSAVASPSGPPLVERERAAAGPLAALAQARFKEAQEQSRQVLKADGDNPYAHLVLAISQYRQTMHDVVTDLMTFAAQVFSTATINQRYLEFTLDRTAKELREVSEHLAAADAFPELALELCLACWEVDWNRSGEVDRRDRLILQVELDARGQEIPEGDPRRKPTFRFDHGDVAWARAFLSFQRAALALLSAYDWGSANPVLQSALRKRSLTPLRIKLKDPGRVKRGQELILEGLGQAELGNPGRGV